MLTQIDHVVILSTNLNEAVEGATEAGFMVTPGGEHGEGGTHNALIPFADGSYIELLAFRDEPPDDHYFAARIGKGPGLADLALLSDDLAADLGQMASRGMTYPAPTALSRVRPDGVEIAWRMSLPALTPTGKGYPFLIEDTSDRRLRVAGSVTHANGVTGLAGVTIATSDLDGDARAIAALLGVANPRSEFGNPGKGIAIIPLPNGTQWLALVQALPDTSPGQHVARFGRSPYAVALLTAATETMHPWDGTAIDPALMSGARIKIG